MQKIPKTAINSKKSDKLEKELKEQEKELEAIKEAFEKNNMNALNNLPIKNLPKTSRFSAKVPKRLSEKEKQKRDELRSLKEIENLGKIQQKLFKEVNNRRKIEPIDKRILTTNQKFINIDKDDIFAMNLNKECERVFGKENSKQYIPNKTVTTIRKKEKSVKRNTSIKKDNKNIIKKNLEYPLSAINRKSKKNEKSDKNDKNVKILTDEEKDEEFLKNLQDELKQFYMEREEEIFNFLKEIHLCRFISCFLAEGYDIFEEFIELPMDFFDKMEKPFLNKEQQEKLYNKLSIFKTNKEKKIENKINIFSKTQPQSFRKNKKSSTNINKTNKDENTNINININRNAIKENEKIESGTTSMIKREELFNTNNLDIAELERQNAEDFKKAVNEWRNNKYEPANDYGKLLHQQLIDVQINIDKESKESNAPVNESSLLVNSPDEIICCWNCFKPIKKENSVQKDYENQFDNSILFTNKNFCSPKCIKDYEKKKKAKYVCFQCNEIFDLYKGFVAYEGEKYCSTKCRDKYIEIENEIIKNNKNNHKKKKEKLKKIEKIEKKVKNEEEEEYNEGDNYDPMDDF